jgi:hypothetical protein
MKNLEMAGTLCNSALRMRTICFPKPVSELVLQTGLARPRSWTEEGQI